MAKFLTWLERAPVSQALTLDELFAPAAMTFRFGITGPPGAGKSTLIARLLGHLRARGLKVGVIAVDPSSPFTRGAILGDRIRYSEHALDPGVFIRSLGTRGSLGGLSSAAFLMARAFDACRFDLLLVETVGVGQTELDILHVADQVCVVLVPESGDSVQAMKAGLMEIADIFVVNKSDRPGADSLAREIEAAEVGVQVLRATASENKGVRELAEFLIAARAGDWQKSRVSPERWREEAGALMRGEWERGLAARLQDVRDLESFRSRLCSPKSV